ncbi:hypothetical protein OG921_24610 [Aldersonia sp. NBC_00410]|jgi:hypothetical protein|uniref:hypothetical protein n=1 Tax=Aldersonia sp. NBC_00410 TaxID=2975954 RepID=UPI0022538B53|nr:hypothetical protein [Aldersonia sp. NBC_00410]MCX5046359.1 hypothetical protein [Aldersonia sp. NBC_00410]
MSESPVSLVERYLFELYNNKNVDLVREICGDPMTRHSAGAVTELTRDEQAERITKDLAAHDPFFTVVTLVGDDTFASLTWNAERRSTGEKLCGIEIFKARDGVITDVWNSNYFEGSWS